MSPMSYTVEFDSEVAGGFPVTVIATMQRAEPDVGIMGDYAEEFEILTRKGMPAPFIEKKITEDDWSRLAYEAEECER